MLVLLLAIAGAMLLLANELVSQRAAPPKVGYKYLPRDRDTYIRDMPQASAVFDGLEPKRNPDFWLEGRFRGLAPE